MSEMDTTRLEEMLDWLAGEVARRLRAGQALRKAAPQPAPPPPPQHREATAPPLAQHQEAVAPSRAPETREPAAGLPPDEGPGAASMPSHAAQLLSRLALALVLAVLLINIPLGLHGRALARMIPSRTYVVIRGGLLVKESGSPDVYVYRDGEFHWITDLAVFERYGYRWADVREVAPGFLDSYKIGRPLYLLAKCPNSPHVYRLENGVKRWIVDIPAFEAEGYRWEDVRTIDCYTLSNMPMGETIPPGHGPAPEP